MSHASWVLFGASQIDSDQVRKVAKTVEELLYHTAYGGNMSTVVDSWCISDDAIKYVLDNQVKTNYAGSPAHVHDLEIQVANALLKLSFEKRNSVLGLVHHFWGQPNTP